MPYSRWSRTAATCVALCIIVVVSVVGEETPAPTGRHSMKIVQSSRTQFGETGVEPVGDTFDHTSVELHGRRKPRPAILPEAWKRNTSFPCLTLHQDRYYWVVCPFDNVTQHDVTTTWNPYHGILGVFSHWEIANETLKSMIFTDGDSCGSKLRETNVTLVCGTTERLAEASEPETCSYQLRMETPLACNGTLSVFRLLNRTDAEHWRSLQQELYDEEITSVGFDKRTRQLLRRVGLLPNETTTAEGKRAASDKQSDETRQQGESSTGSQEAYAMLDESALLAQTSSDVCDYALARMGIDDDCTGGILRLAMAVRDLYHVAVNSTQQLQRSQNDGGTQSTFDQALHGISIQRMIAFVGDGETARGDAEKVRLGKPTGPESEETGRDASAHEVSQLSSNATLAGQSNTSDAGLQDFGEGL